MIQKILAVAALAISQSAIASESLSFTCSATSMEPTASGVRFAYQIKGFGFRSHSIPGDTPTLNASAASINVYQISPSGTVSQVLKNGTIAEPTIEEICDNDFCSVVKTYNVPQSTYGLKAIIASSRHQESDKYVSMDFILEHKLSPTTLSKGQGLCQVQSEEGEEHHGSDVIVDNNGKFVLVPNGENELPTLIKESAFSTTLNDVLDEDLNVGRQTVRGGFISSSARNPRTNKVAIGIEHVYRVLSSFSAVYVYDPATKTITNAPYCSVPSNRHQKELGKCHLATA